MNRPHRPRKRFSQNFLNNPFYQRKIVDALNIASEDTILEIGPGRGALTEHIINAKPRYFYAVEIDTILVEKLNERFREHVEIIQDDILKFDFSAMMTKNQSSLSYNQSNHF